MHEQSHNVLAELLEMMRFSSLKIADPAQGLFSQCVEKDDFFGAGVV